jgi:hypothetical protein
MNTTENNKLIAEFMGVGYVDIDTYLENSKELQYHNSWDWLIPVVQKLIYVYISIDQQDERGLEQNILYGDINDVYKLVVEHINEYNRG